MYTFEGGKAVKYTTDTTKQINYWKWLLLLFQLAISALVRSIY